MRTSASGISFLFIVTSYRLDLAGGELDDLFLVVIIRRFVSLERTAFAAFVSDDEALFGVWFCGYGIHDAFAVGCAVTGIDIEMQGAETYGAMVTRGIFQRRHFMSAVFADERIVVFCKSFGFHRYDPLPIIFGCTDYSAANQTAFCMTSASMGAPSVGRTSPSMQKNFGPSMVIFLHLW